VHCALLKCSINILDGPWAVDYIHQQTLARKISSFQSDSVMIIDTCIMYRVQTMVLV